MTITRHRADVVVVGGGTAGAIVAARYVAAGARTVVLESGPDYGPYTSGRWPRALLDAASVADIHDWGYRGAGAGGQPLALDRAMVIGGCSAHNGCTQSTGWRGDYDAWSAHCPGWGGADLAQCFERAAARLRVHRPTDDQIQPFHQAVLEACRELGIHRTDDLDNLDGEAGVSVSSVNIVNGVRWNTAFAYLDDHRKSSNLTIISDAHANSVELEHERATAVMFTTPTGPGRVTGNRIVVCAGTYGTPALLMRSGIGPQRHLESVGVQPSHVLEGVGQSLQDQPVVSITLRATPALEARLADFGRHHRFTPDEQVVAKLAGSQTGEAPYDHHLFPWTEVDASGQLQCVFAIGLLKPDSVGSVELRSADPAHAPRIDHRYLTHAGDVDRLVEQLDTLSTLIHTSALADLVIPPDEPLPGTLAAARSWVRTKHRHYWHPTSTARMGRADDMSVVDERCRVHGLDHIDIVDASIFPSVPRATTALPVAAIAERYCELAVGAPAVGICR